MIREKHLVPGRVIANVTTESNPIFDDRGRHTHSVLVDVWHPCMVISYVADIGRRHAKKTAPRNKWEVLVWWMDERQRKLESVMITPNSVKWKSLW